MRVGITTYGGDEGRSGIGRYISCLLESMAQSAETDEAEVLVHRQETSAFFPKDTPAFRRVTTPGLMRDPVLDIAWHQLGLGPLSLARGYDVLFLPAANRRLAAFAPCPTVGTYHDGGILHVVDKYDPARRFYLTKVLPRLVRKLTHVLTVSEATKRDLVNILGVSKDRITVTPLAADRRLYYPRDPEEMARHIEKRFGIAKPYLLYVSRLEHPGKNHVRLIEAFAKARKEHGLRHDLVLAGSDWSGSEFVHAAAETSSVSGSIHMLGYVPNIELPALYSAAAGVVFPSLFEGFGLPILEAMSSGVPVASSNTSSLPEVAGDAALLFDPVNVDEMAAAIARLAMDTPLRSMLVGRGLSRAAAFSWEKTAVATWRVLRSVTKHQ